MCPACLASVALVAGSVISTGGITAIAVQLFRRKKNEPTDVPNKTERRNEDGNGNR